VPDDGFAYVLGLEDQLSGPAKAEVSALQQLEGQIGKTEKALRQFRDAQGRFIGKERAHQLVAAHPGMGVEELRAHLGSLKPPGAAKETESVFGLIGQHLAEANGASLLFAGGLAAVGFAAATAVEKLGELGVDSVKFAIEAAEFKHNTEIAYAAVKGTAEEGAATFKEIDAMARAVHMPAEQAHKLASDLMLQGLEDTKAIGAVIAADAALMRTGQLQGAEKLKAIVERSLASGHFDPGKLGGGKGGEASGRALAGLGVHLPDLIADLAKRTGESLEVVKYKLQKGKIDTQVGIAALTDAIDKSPIGTAAKSKFDFGDFFTDLENKWRGIVQDVDLAPLEQGLLNLETALGSVDGSGIKGVFQTVVDGIGEAITEVTLFAQDVEIASLEAQIALKPLSDLIGAIDDGMKQIGAGGGLGLGAEGGGGAIEGLDLSYRPGASGLGTVLSPDTEGGYAPPSMETPANAAGGEVMSPAPGEVFASVAPGEFIVPAGGAPGNDNGGGQVVHVDVGGLHFHGAVDQHNVIPLLESQLADVFERVALERGR
jgi:hypothetical protein